MKISIIPTVSRHSAKWLLAACLAAVAQAAAAIEGVKTPGLARAVDAAWQRAVEARRAEGETVRADGGRRIARSFAADAPSLSYSRKSGAWDNRMQTGVGRETEVGVIWPLWMPGQRSAALDAARADVNWADANLARTRLEVAGKVREAAWDVAARGAGLDLAQVKAGFLKKLADDVERRVKAGELARSDALSANADLLGAQAELADAQRELHDSQGRWRVLTGLDELPDAGEIENEAHVDVKALLAAAGTPPSLVAAEEAVRRAQGELAAASRSLGSPPELSVGVREANEVPGAPSNRALTVALTVPLGLGARRSLVRSKAQTELDAAEAELALARSRHAAELDAAQLAISLSDEQLVNEGRRARLLAERVQLMQKAFAAGEIDLAALLLATRYSHEADADLARRKAEHGLAHARLLQVIGMLP